MTRAHCEICPRPADGYCLGEDHKRICALRDPGHPDFDPAYRNASLANEAGAIRRPVPASPGDAQPELISPAISFAVVRCPHRTKLPACGCAGRWRCERDAADVAWDDCVRCKAAEAQIPS